MVNEKGRPKKYLKKSWNVTSMYIPPFFKGIHEMLKKLSHQDKDNEEFRSYCKKVEGIDVSTKGQGVEGIYKRWVWAKHVMDNRDKLVEEDN